MNTWIMILGNFDRAQQLPLYSIADNTLRLITNKVIVMLTQDGKKTSPPCCSAHDLPPPRLKQSVLPFLQFPGSPTEGDKHQAVCVETWWVIQRNGHVLTNSSQQGPVRLGHRPLLAPGLCLLTLSRVKWSEMKEMFSSLPTWTENWFGRLCTGPVHFLVYRLSDLSLFTTSVSLHVVVFSTFSL